MKIISADAQYLKTDGSNLYEHIEKIGRTCYKSNDLISPGSASKFVSAMRKSKHYAMLEHGHVIFRLPQIFIAALQMTKNPEDYAYLHFTDGLFDASDSNIVDFGYVSGSFRAFIEYFDKTIPEDLTSPNSTNLAASAALKTCLSKKYPELFDEPAAIITGTSDVVMFDSYTDFYEDVKNSVDDQDKFDEIMRRHMPHSVLFICDRGVSHEFVRHRPAAFAQESTRYCNYAKDKFGNEITVIKPCFWDEEKDDILYDMWKASCELDEKSYFSLLDAGATPQQARDVLPTSVKTELNITATEDEWQHIMNLRFHGTTGAPHPQMIEVMDIIKDTLIKESEERIH